MDGLGGMRGKTMTISSDSETSPSPDKLPMWKFDGSNTGQAIGRNSEVFLKPVKVFPDPFRRVGDVIVLCECVPPNDDSGRTKESIGNHRDTFVMLLKKKKDLGDPWFGFGQEYFLCDQFSGTPIGWLRGIPDAQRPYYCGSNTGRHIVESHYEKCTDMGLNIRGVNAEAAPGQWEFRIVGEDVDAADYMVVARYVLDRIAEDHQMSANFHPKPVPGNLNGSKLHTNFSTRKMRAKNGIGYLEYKHHPSNIDPYRVCIDLVEAIC